MVADRESGGRASQFIPDLTSHVTANLGVNQKLLVFDSLRGLSLKLVVRFCLVCPEKECVSHPSHKRYKP